MSVRTLSAQPGQDAMPAAVPWQRMLWVTWRQHRGMLIGLVAVLGAIAIFLLISGLWIHHNFSTLMACHPTATNDCGQLEINFNNTDWTMGNTVLIFMNLAPALIGAFTGPAVMARELETGTFRYAWTQGIGRVRWTIAKLALLGVVITVLAWAFSQLFAWYFDPFLTTAGMNVLAATVFATRGVSFAAWTLVAFTVGAFLGMLFRRIVPAMAATLGVYLGLALLTWLYLRAHYLPLAVGLVPATPRPQSPDNPWVISTWISGGKSWESYIPVSRFWPMQFIEGGWLLVLAVLLVAATVWLVRRRAA